MTEHLEIPEAISARITALNERLDAILKEGDGGSSAPAAASGPDASDVHVPSTNMGGSKPKKPKKAKQGASNG